MVTLTVQAVRGRDTSAIETRVVCQFSVLAPCVCLPVEGQSRAGTVAANEADGAVPEAPAGVPSVVLPAAPAPATPARVVVQLPTFPALTVRPAT